MKDILKKYWGLILLLLLAGGVALFHFNKVEPNPEPILFANYLPEKAKKDCPVMVRVTGLVDLARPLELHQENDAIPCGCEAVTGQLWEINQTIEAKYKEPDSLILSRIKSPAPDRVIVGQWINYKIRVVKNPDCLPDKVPTKPVPKDNIKDAEPERPNKRE